MVTVNVFVRISLLYSFLVFLIPAANGHIVLKTPTPYGNPDTSPLEASGSNYPCKLPAGFNATNFQSVSSGSTFEATFSGTAVHNGGSCQFAVTKDMQPSKTSDFRVILSIEGGCPGLNGQTTSYQVTAVPELASGNWVATWVWYNNIGNREIYQNCFGLNVVGSTASEADFESLPPMALYNLEDFNSCKTVETYDVEFPNPGKYVIKGSGFKPQAPSGCGSKTGTVLDAGASGGMGPSGNSTGSSSSSGSSSADGGSASYTSTSSTTVMSTIYASSTSVESTVTESGQQTTATSSAAPYANSSAAGGAAPTTLATSISPAGAAPSTPAPAPGGNGNGTSGSGSATTQSCQTNGAVVCSSDGTLFGLCNFGVAVMESVSAGTKCTNGEVVRRSAKFGRS